MSKTDVIIIGAGVVGLAVAAYLSTHTSNVILVEKHDGFGRETSSRNSEVIHAGIYHDSYLLKTQLCIRGNRLLYDACLSSEIPHQKIGKILVATDQLQVNILEKVQERGEANGVEGLRLMTGKEVREEEPFVHAVAGLYSPQTGIIDSHSLMKYLEETANSNEAIIAYNCEVVGLAKKNSTYSVEIQDADDSLLEVEAPIVVNSAGICADKIAAYAGIDVDAVGYRIYPCKGEYFSVSNRHKGKMRRLIYPTPIPGFSGNHPTMDLSGRVRIGPNLFYVDEINYDVDPSHRPEVYNEVKDFLPFIEETDLMPDTSGIRPKLYRRGEAFRDFVIRDESEHGLPGLVNLIGIESPGLTACLAIGEVVEKIIYK